MFPQILALFPAASVYLPGELRSLLCWYLRGPDQQFPGRQDAASCLPDGKRRVCGGVLRVEMQEVRWRSLLSQRDPGGGCPFVKRPVNIHHLSCRSCWYLCFHSTERRFRFIYLFLNLNDGSHIYFAATLTLLAQRNHLYSFLFFLHCLPHKAHICFDL